MEPTIQFTARQHDEVRDGRDGSTEAEVRLLRALADPTRLSIVRQLASEVATCQCDLTACCEVAQPTVSHHLKVLREAGLVRAERRGTWMYYTLDPGGMARLARVLGGLLPLDSPVAGLGRRLPVVEPSNLQSGTAPRNPSVSGSTG